MGSNPIFKYLLAGIGVFAENHQQFGRLRDGWVTDDGAKVFILHRNYGEAGADALKAFSELPGFVSNTPCDDHTYAICEFDITDEDAKSAFKSAADKLGAEVTENRMQRYVDMIQDLQAGDRTSPEAKQALAVGADIVDAVKTSIDDGKPHTVDDGQSAVDIIPL